MTIGIDTSPLKSKEPVCNNSTRNCVVKEIILPGKAGTQISVSKFEIDIANEKNGNLSTCTITLESNGNEKQKSKWSNSKTVYTTRDAEFEYVADAGYDVKIRIYLKTTDKNYAALATNFKYTYTYVGNQVEEPVQEKAYLVVECESEDIATALMPKIQGLAPTAKISTLV